MQRTALYPGSFDPVTLGHIDIIKRATKIFDHLIVAVAHNSRKTYTFTPDERLDMLKKSAGHFDGISFQLFDGLVADFARENNIHVLVRGIRMISDFEFEFQMALTNRRLNDTLETMFLMPSEGYSFLSSTLIKETAAMGGDISSFVPPIVVEKCQDKNRDE